MRKLLRTSGLIPPLLLLFSCLLNARQDSRNAADSSEMTFSSVPVSTDTSKAVSLVTRVRSFNSSGLNVVTFARSLQGKNKRLETLTELTEESAISIEIHRGDLRQIFRLDPANKSYTEIPFPRRSAEGSSPSASRMKTVRRPVECQSKTEINGPGPDERINNQNAKLYKVNTKMVCRDKGTKREMRRYTYREYVWVSDKELQLDSSIRVSSQTLYSYDMLAPTDIMTDLGDTSSDSGDMDRELASLLKKHVWTVLSIPGTPVRRDQVSTTVLKGKEVPFAPPASAKNMEWFDPAKTGSVPDISSEQDSEHPKPKIPDWVLSVDPNFAKHGGTAKRVDYMDIQIRSPKGLFDVPRQYRLVPEEK